MLILITIVAAGLGVAYARLIDRRFGPRSRTAWMLLLPVGVAYAVVLFTADTTQPGPRAVLSFGIGALAQSAIDGWRADRPRRRQINAAEAAVRATPRADVRAKHAQAEDQCQLPSDR